MHRGAVGSHSTEKGEPRCSKSFQGLILLCSSLHPQMQPFLPHLFPLPSSPQPAGLCEEEDLSLSRLLHPLSLVASPVLSPLPLPCPSSHPWEQHLHAGPEVQWACLCAQLIAMLQASLLLCGPFVAA